MLQCALSWLGGGSYLHTRVITGILAPRFTTTQDDIEKVATEFQSLSNGGVIDKYIGTIEGWLCPIKVPRKNECGRVISFFSGYYQKYGLNVQACADHLSRFTAFPINLPGGMNNVYAFQRWKLDVLLHESSGQFFVIGDNAYVQSKNCDDSL